ncbi:MAG: DUF4389 domain-containing protein [Kofleriaceae bacterium]
MSDDLRLEIASPAHFDRTQLLLRIAIAIVLGWFGITLGWTAGVLYLVLPVLAAVGISAVGRERYQAEYAPRVQRALQWLLGFEAYLILLTDRLPTSADEGFAIEVHPSGTPTIASSLLRLITSAPSALVGLALSCFGGLLWLPGAIWILAGARVPRWILAYQRGVLRWQAGVLAYHASIVAHYPRWTFDTHDHAAVAA